MLVYVRSHTYSSIHIQYRTIESFKTSIINVDDHFRKVTKMIALADYLPTSTIVAKNLATKMTNYNVEQIYHNDMLVRAPCSDLHAYLFSSSKESRNNRIHFFPLPLCGYSELMLSQPPVFSIYFNKFGLCIPRVVKPIC